MEGSIVQSAFLAQQDLTGDGTRAERLQAAAAELMAARGEPAPEAVERALALVETRQTGDLDELASAVEICLQSIFMAFGTQDTHEVLHEAGR